MMGQAKGMYDPPGTGESGGIGRSVMYRVPNIAVSQVILYEAGIQPLIGQFKPAGMPQHVGVYGQRDLSQSPVIAQQRIKALPGQALTGRG